MKCVEWGRGKRSELCFSIFHGRSHAALRHRFSFRRSRQGWRFCTSYEFQGDASAAGPCICPEGWILTASFSSTTVTNPCDSTKTVDPGALWPRQREKPPCTHPTTGFFIPESCMEKGAELSNNKLPKNVSEPSLCFSPLSWLGLLLSWCHWVWFYGRISPLKRRWSRENGSLADGRVWLPNPHAHLKQMGP